MTTVTKDQLDSIEILLKTEVSPEVLRSVEEKYSNRKLLLNKDSKLEESDFNLFFQYGMLLIQSKYKSDWPKGRELMEELYIKSDDAVAKRDYLFYCSIAETKMKNYPAALKFVKSILYVEPFNVQAQALEQYISGKKERDLLIGAGAIGGLGLVGIMLLSGLSKR